MPGFEQTETGCSSPGNPGEEEAVGKSATREVMLCSPYVPQEQLANCGYVSGFDPVSGLFLFQSQGCIPAM